MSTDKTATTSFSQESDVQTKDASQTSSSDYAVAHTSITVQRRALPPTTPKPLLPVSQQAATETFSSDYTIARITDTLVRPRPLPKPLPKPGKPTSSISSHVVTQTLSTDYPVSHSHMAATTKVTNVENTLKTVKKEKIEDVEEEKDNSEDTETLNPFLGTKCLPHNAITVGALLGQGAFGQVYRGEWGTRAVALKKIDLQHAKKHFPHIEESQILESLQWEVSRLSTVSHPNLVQFYGIYEPKQNELPYLVMEFCEGGTLQSMLEREQTKLPWSKRWQWALEIAQGLTYLHHQGVLHRDLKAENVLIDGNGRAKLGDLGVAQVDALLQGKEAEIVESGLQDKRFIAPENVDSPTLSTQATDVYALGLVFWQLLTGKKPRRLTELNSNALQQWLKGSEREPIPNDCPSSFKALILGCWERDPQKRPSAEKLVTQLNSLATEFHPKPELIKTCEQLEFIIHPKRQETLRYVAPYVTESRVDEAIDTYWQGWEAKSLENLSEDERRQNPPLKLEETLVNFIHTPGSSTLLLLGESGLGKTLSAYQWSDQLLGQWWQYLNDPASKPAPLYLPLFIRPLVSQWTHRNLRNAFLNALKTTGLQGTHVPLLVIVDGYDECQLDEIPHNLVDHLGLSGQNNVKLIVTCRPDVVPTTGLSTRFAFQGQLQVRHFLPFKVEQLLMHLKNQLAWEDILYQQYQTQLKEADGLRAVLRNPFVLHLFTESWETISKQELSSLNRFKIYEEFIEHSLVSHKGLLSKAIQNMLIIDYVNLVDSFNAFASEVAFKAFQSRRLNLLKESVQLMVFPWSLLETYFEKDARKRFTRQQKQLVNQNPEGKARRALLDEADYMQLMQQRRERFERELPLKRKEQLYEYIHKSFFEYFAAKYLLQLVKYDTQSIQIQGLMLLNNRPIQEEPEILRFWYEGWGKEHQVLVEPFFKIIQISKTDKNISQAASNVTTLLNVARVSFVGRDLHGVQIPSADLSRALLDHTNFQGANLRGVQLQYAFLRKTNLKQADLTGVTFGEVPVLKQGVCSSDGRWLAIAEGKTIGLWTGDGAKQVGVLVGHKETITSVAFSPNGDKLVSGSWDNTVRLWSVGSGKELTRENGTARLWSAETGEELTWEGREELLRDICCPSGTVRINCSPLYVDMPYFSPTGDKLSRSWVVESERELAVLNRHSDSIMSVAFSPNGEQFASGSRDRTICLWSVNERKELGVLGCAPNLLIRLSGHTDYVSSVAFSPKGDKLISGSWDKTVRLWSLDTREELGIFVGHTNYVDTVSFSPNGQILASGSTDKTIRLWSVSGKELASLEGHMGGVSALVFSPNGDKLLSSGTWDETLRLWSVSSKKELAVFVGSIMSIAFSPKGNKLISRSNGLCLWSESNKELAFFEGHTGTVTSVVFSSNGELLASGSADKTVRLWSVESGRELVSLEGHMGGVTSVVFSPNGELLGSGSEDATIRLWSVSSGKELAVLVGHTKKVVSLSFSPAGNKLASGSTDKTVRLWSVDSGKELATLIGHIDEVNSVAFSPNGDQFVSGGKDDLHFKNGVRFWSVSSGKELPTTLKGDTGRISFIVFSPKGDKLAINGEIWSVENGRKLATLELKEGHGDYTRIAFSPNGEQLASVGSMYKAIIYLWSIDNLKEPTKLATLSGHTDRIWSISFSPKGDKLASGSSDYSILVWGCVSADYKTWHVRFRIMAEWRLTAPDAQLEGAIISDKNHQLLKQRGAEGKHFITVEDTTISSSSVPVSQIDQEKTLTTTTTLTTNSGISITTTTPMINFYHSPVSQSTPSGDISSYPKMEDKQKKIKLEKKQILPSMMKETLESDESKKEEKGKDKKCLVM